MAQHQGVELPIRQNLDHHHQSLHSANFHFQFNLPNSIPFPVPVTAVSGSSSGPLPIKIRANGPANIATLPGNKNSPSVAALSRNSIISTSVSRHCSRFPPQSLSSSSLSSPSSSSSLSSPLQTSSSALAPLFSPFSQHPHPAPASAPPPPPPPPPGTRAINIPAPTAPTWPITSSSCPPPVAAAANSSRNSIKHKHSRSSYSEGSTLGSRNNSATFRPPKRPMHAPNKTIAVINSSGRQAAAVIRVATAVGYRVRAQLRSLDGFIAAEVADNPNVTVLVGDLYTRSPYHNVGSPAHPGDLHSQRTGDSDSGLSSCSDRDDITRKGPEPVAGVGVNHALITELFEGAQLAFINTTFYGDELQIGKALLDAAKAAGVEHYVYSSMPDHSAYHPDWPALPLWAAKHQVEDYVRESGIPATFVYTGIYNNNFTSLIYPLFCTEQQADGSFIWQAPFHRDAKLPWLDVEHDMGPAILQIFKDGPTTWANRRIALAYEMLSPLEACEAFSRGLGRPLRYVQAPIDIKVKIPTGYRQQLEALEKLFTMGGDDPTKQPPYFGDAELEASCPAQAMDLWEGPRLLEEYAREVFPVEEHANGMRWMLDDYDEGGDAGEEGSSLIVEDTDDAAGAADYYNNDDDDDDDGGLELKARKRDEEKWLA